MSNTFRSPADTINLPAPANVSSGVPIAIGNLVAVPLADALSGEIAAFSVSGEHELPADSADTMAAGDVLVFDASTNTIQPNGFTTAAGDIVACGVCTKAKANGDLTVWLKINSGGQSVA